MAMKPSNALKFLLAFLFPLLVVCLYYLTNKPITPLLVQHLGLVVWRCLVAAGLLIVSGGLGALLAPLRQANPLERLALQAALGLGVWAALVLIVGATVGLSIGLWSGLLLAAGALLRRGIRAWIADWGALPSVWHASDPFGRAIAALLGVALGAAALIALAPPLKYDALMYHFTLPNAYLNLGKVAYLDWIVMSGHPQNAEMLYTLAMRFGGLEAAALFGWSFAPLVVVGLLGYLQPRLGTRAAWVSAAALLAGYSLTTSTADGYVDWLALLFGFGCLVSMDRWSQNRQRSDLLLAGAFAGLALGTKYTAGVLGLVAGIALVGYVWKLKIPLLKQALVFGTPAVGFALPWLVKNALTTGNPLYPFFIPSGAMDAVRIAVYQGLPPFGNALDFFLLPFRAVLLGVEGGAGYSVSMGPLLLGLGGLAWIGARERAGLQRSALSNAAVFSLSGVLIWAVGNQLSGYLIQTRMYFPLFPGFAVLAAFGYDSAAQLHLPQVRLGRILNILVLLVLGLNTFATLLKPVEAGSLAVVLGLTSQQSYLEKNLGGYQQAVEAIQQLDPPARTLWIYEPRSLYCYPQCAPDEILDRWAREYSATVDFTEIRQKWLDEGFTYLMVNRSGVEFLKENPDPHHPQTTLLALDEFLSKLRLIKNIGDAYNLYSLY